MPAGDPGILPGSCPNRKESQPLNSRYASLFLQNYFPTMPFENEACKEHSVGLAEMVDACFRAAGNMMPNFIAVNFYMVLSSAKFQIEKFLSCLMSLTRKYVHI